MKQRSISSHPLQPMLLVTLTFQCPWMFPVLPNLVIVASTLHQAWLHRSLHVRVHRLLQPNSFWHSHICKKNGESPGAASGQSKGANAKGDGGSAANSHMAGGKHKAPKESDRTEPAPKALADQNHGGGNAGSKAGGEAMGKPKGKAKGSNESKSLVPCQESGASYTIAWIAAARNRKHIWCPATAPSAWHVHAAIHRFANKLSWRVKLGANSGDTPWVARYPKAPIAVCELQNNLPLECWKTHVVSTTMLAASNARKAHLHMGSSWSSISPLDRLGRITLKNSACCLAPRDKGCGYVIHRSDLRSIHNSILNGHEYQRVSMPNFSSIKSMYCSHASSVVKCFLTLSTRTL
jgi:hypothetical protein